MERRKTLRKDWVVGKDDVGHSVLEWKVDYRRPRGSESDPCARTYDFLKRLEVADLALEDDKPRRMRQGLNPYDAGSFPRQKIER
jgi:hypothetical protein